MACAGVKKSYRNGSEIRAILDDVSIDVGPAEWIAISGPSGVGKTTLLHLLAGILPPDDGEVRWDGEDIYALREPERDRRRAVRAGLVFQFHHLLPDLSVEENINLALSLARKKISSQELENILSRLGVLDIRRSRIDKLSGGERQRVAVARALVHRPSILFADEPTGNLDEHATMEFLDLFDSVRRLDGVSIVMVTHNPTVSARADRRMALSEGRLVLR